jgi:hypothetical protein
MRGGHLTILAAHTGRHITKAQRDRWVELMIETAREVLPGNETFQERFRTYIEFGADIAVRASQADTPPTSAGPVPKWDWEPGRSRAPGTSGWSPNQLFRFSAIAHLLPNNWWASYRMRSDETGYRLHLFSYKTRRNRVKRG